MPPFTSDQLCDNGTANEVSMPTSLCTWRGIPSPFIVALRGMTISLLYLYYTCIYWLDTIVSSNHEIIGIHVT
ncbi:hypothetical protein IQ07DRAFT_393918 [Pyrenochaeta sp. DS3sAY3a]|nr:hypothetical protein IQ07DRAFT_393918 [Pyrenochaeta sp. DS3sAY3a]